MGLKLVSIARIDAVRWKAHAADEHGFPLCNTKKMGTPVIPGTVKLECEKCRDILLKRLIPQEQAVVAAAAAE
jgi:hypothetical protein